MDGEGGAQPINRRAGAEDVRRWDPGRAPVAAAISDGRRRPRRAERGMLPQDLVRLQPGLQPRSMLHAAQAVGGEVAGPVERLRARGARMSWRDHVRGREHGRRRR